MRALGVVGACAVAIVAFAVLWSTTRPDRVDPATRAAAVFTVGCGDGFASSGSGVIVGGDRVVTAAHVVVQAESVDVVVAGVRARAQIVGLDLTRDLAILAVDGLDASQVTRAKASAGDQISMAPGSGQSLRPGTVIEPVTLTIEEVLGTQRHTRAGYQLDLESTDGDSGSGVFDGAGHLVGVLFATGTDASWATAVDEVDEVLRADPGFFTCHPDQSKVIRSG